MITMITIKESNTNDIINKCERKYTELEIAMQNYLQNIRDFIDELPSALEDIKDSPKYNSITKQLLWDIGDLTDSVIESMEEDKSLFYDLDITKIYDEIED